MPCYAQFFKRLDQCLDGTESAGRTSVRHYISFTGQLLQVLVVIVLLTTLGFEVYTRSPFIGPTTPLSSKIELGLAYVGYTVSSVIINVSYLYYRSEVICLEQNFSTYSCSFRTHWKGKQCTLVLFLYSGPVVAWLTADCITALYLSLSFSPNSKQCILPLIPCNNFYYNVASILFSSWTASSSSYACIFITYAGIRLTHNLKNVAKKFELLLIAEESVFQRQNGITFRSRSFL